MAALLEQREWHLLSLILVGAMGVMSHGGMVGALASSPVFCLAMAPKRDFQVFTLSDSSTSTWKASCFNVLTVICMAYVRDVSV